MSATTSCVDLHHRLPACLSYQKKKLAFANFFFNQNGNVLLSQAVSHQVSSALRSLTSVFGMGTGVTSSLLSPHFLLVFSSCCCVAAYSIVSHILKYAPSSLARAPCIRIKIHRNSF